VGTFFCAADLVVLPYESASQSGIVQIAFAYGKPVVVTSVGGLSEVVRNDKTGYIIEPGNVRAIAESVVLFFEQNKGEAFSAEINRERDRFSWRCMVETIEELVQKQE